MGYGLQVPDVIQITPRGEKLALNKYKIGKEIKGCKILKENSIDISKIAGSYQLLGAFLVIIDSIMAVWFYKAENYIERIIAGILLALISLSFLYLVIKREEKKDQYINPPGLGKVSPAREEATENEIINPEPQKIGASDGSYIIDKPPEDWIVRKIGLTEWTKETSDTFLFKNNEILEETENTHETEILLFQSPKQLSIIPIPGKTILNRMKLPIALAEDIYTRLAIIRLDKIRPPLFFERPFEDSFFKNISFFLQTDTIILRKLLSGIISKSNIRFYEADFSQDIENAIVDGKEEMNVANNFVAIDIEGEISDHLLFITYPYVPDIDNPDIKILKTLVESFRPLKMVHDNKYLQLKKFADIKLEELAKNSQNFFAQFAVAILRLKKLNLENNEECLIAIKKLKSFEILAKEADIHDDNLNNLWSSLHDAEKGNLLNLKDELNKIIEIMNEITETIDDINK